MLVHLVIIYIHNSVVWVSGVARISWFSQFQVYKWFIWIQFTIFNLSVPSTFHLHYWLCMYSYLCITITRWWEIVCITFTADLSTHKKKVIGTTEADFKRVSMNGREHVFVNACAVSLDRARIICANINFQGQISDFPSLLFRAE